MVSGLLRASLSTKYRDGQVSRVSAVLQLKRLYTGKWKRNVGLNFVSP